MYGIFITCAYLKANGWEEQTEQYHSLEFEDIDVACVYLRENIESICNDYPLQSVEIKIIKP